MVAISKTPASSKFVILERIRDANEVNVIAEEPHISGLQVEVEGTSAKLSWSHPTGDFDRMSIQQCEVKTGACSEVMVEPRCGTNWCYFFNSER